MLFLPRERSRQLTHLALLLLTVLACLVTARLVPDASFVRVVTIGLGYLALAQIVLALLIGPAQLLLKSSRHRNPANIMLRRDVGIWAGINGLLHVVFGLQMHMGGDIRQYFFEPVERGSTVWRLRPLTQVFGFSNYTGALATILLALLLLLSNDLALKWLRGPVWKWIQRLNYLMTVLVLAHTFGYQVEADRPAGLIVIVAGLTLLTVAAQLGGALVSIRRSKAPSAPGAADIRGCLAAAGVATATPLLLAVCLAGLWLFRGNPPEIHPSNRAHTPGLPPAHATTHATAAPQHLATAVPQHLATPALHPGTPEHNPP